MGRISSELLEFLACPRCKGELTRLKDQAILRCGPCGYSYPVRDGIPVLLIEEAQKTASPHEDNP